MRTVKVTKTLKLIRALLYVALVPLALCALFSYLYYRLLVMCVGTLIVLWLISRLRRSRSGTAKYRWGVFIGAAMLCTALVVSPEFNFLLTFPIRQQIVAHFIETHNPPQFDVPITTVLLGKTTGNIDVGDDVAVYFRYYGVGLAVSDRAFIIYTTRPIAQIEGILYAEPGTARKLKDNWFFIQTGPKGID